MVAGKDMRKEGVKLGKGEWIEVRWVVMVVGRVLVHQRSSSPVFSREGGGLTCHVRTF